MNELGQVDWFRFTDQSKSRETKWRCETDKWGKIKENQQMINDSQTVSGLSIKCAKRSLHFHQCPPPTTHHHHLSLPLSISLFSHCGTNYQLFFPIKKPQLVAVWILKWKPWGPAEYIVSFDGRSCLSQRPNATHTCTHILSFTQSLQSLHCFLIRPDLLCGLSACVCVCARTCVRARVSACVFFFCSCSTFGLL